MKKKATKKEKLQKALDRANAWEFYQNNDQVIAENQETIDCVILAREVRRMRGELSGMINRKMNCPDCGPELKKKYAEFCQELDRELKKKKK